MVAFLHMGKARKSVPGDGVSGGRGVLAPYRVGSPPPADPGGAQGRLVLAQLIQTGLPGHVEPHGLLVVDVDALSRRHVTLVGEEAFLNYANVHTGPIAS